MTLLHELALTPDVLREDGYMGAGACTTSLAFLRPILMEEAVVRDLRDAGWSRFILGSNGAWHPAGRELVKKLLHKARLLPAEPVLATEPGTDLDWGREALESHKRVPVSAIIVGSGVHPTLGKQHPVCSVEKLQLSEWWKTRSCSLRLRRSTGDYQSVLGLALRHANVLRFIDPHLDPSRDRYAEFGTLLRTAHRNGLPPLIELHRVCYEGVGKSRVIFKTKAEMQPKFASLHGELREAGICAAVHVWDDFHDRYFVSNLLGVSMANGFDTSERAEERTTWARLSTRDREDVEREFDEATRQHELRYKFCIGADN